MGWIAFRHSWKRKLQKMGSDTVGVILCDLTKDIEQTV